MNVRFVFVFKKIFFFVNCGRKKGERLKEIYSNTHTHVHTFKFLIYKGRYNRTCLNNKHVQRNKPTKKQSDHSPYFTLL